MWKNRRIESQPEFVPNAEIEDAHYINEEMLKARLQDESNLFREAVYRKLSQYSTSGKEVTWAVFRLIPSDYDSGLMTLRSETEVLIQLMEGYFDRRIDGKKVPIIRIVTNETYPLLNDGEVDEDIENCLAIDFSLDELDNAQFNIDYASHKEYNQDYDEDEIDGQDSTISTIIEEDKVYPS